MQQKKNIINFNDVIICKLQLSLKLFVYRNQHMIVRNGDKTCDVISNAQLFVNSEHAQVCTKLAQGTKSGFQSIKSGFQSDTNGEQ